MANCLVVGSRVKMIEDEKLFYKWVNSLVATYPSMSAIETGDDSEFSPQPPIPNTGNLLADKFPTLYDHVQRVQAIFQHNLAAYQQISRNFELEWRKWKQEKQKSRSQLQQMELKMERIAQEVRSKELFDPQNLFLQSAQSWAKQSESLGLDTRAVVTKHSVPSEREIESLRSQLERVLKEISSEYCSAELR